MLALLKRFLRQERATILDNDIRFETVGRIHEFSVSVQNEIEDLRRVSENNKGMVLRLALNYGGRSEIADATRQIVRDVQAGQLKVENIDENAIQERLYDPDMLDVDLMVRTAGELRISNFLLWQVSYGEIFVSQTYWPDFDDSDLNEALASYGGRNRKFGGLAKPVDA